MDLYPAIDLRDGRCVRLLRGDYAEETRYGDDPVAQAEQFMAQGATRLHVVDLDGARTGEAANRPVIVAIAALTEREGVVLQVGGGVRSVRAADELFDAGVTRVVIGTAAVEDPALVDRLARRCRSEGRGEVAVGIDVRGERVATHGWEQTSGLDVPTMLAAMADRGAVAVVITQIAQDGTMEGPDLDGLSRAVAATDVDVIASGGVGHAGHLRALRDLPGGAPSGVIVGRALYEGTLSVAEALAALAEDGS